MKLTRFFGATALVGSMCVPAAGWAAALAAPAPVQATPPAETTTPAPGNTNDEDVIVVTGSRLRRPDLESTVPVASIKAQDIYNNANPNVGEVLNNLPQLRSTYSQQNPESGIGVAGLNLLDLRGLGPNRTLVLVNGRRHVAADLQLTAAAVDINSIPTDLIDRVDIVTGGNSAVYGSDAIAGVVNFVLKDHFDGLQVRAGTAIPGFGQGGNQYISGIAGKNFGEGRGNITAALEYTHQDRVFGSDVPWLRTSNDFVANDTNPSNGIPNAIFRRDTHSTTIARYGLVPIVQTRNPAAPCGTGIPTATGVRNNYSCDYIFNSTGGLVPVTGTRYGSSINGTFIGGNGDNNREDQLQSVIPRNDRFNANLLAHYKFSDAFDVFFEGKYARAHTIGSNSGPAFNQGAGQTFSDPRASYRLDNPFLSADARNTIANAILASGSNTGLTSGTALTAAQRAAIAAGTYRFVNARNFSDLGIRDEDTVRETFRIVAGVRGQVTPHVNYELSGNYGQTKQNITILGNVNTQRLLLAQDAGRDPADGKIKCRSQFDPAAAFGALDDVGNPDIAQQRLASDIAACVPYNAFGAADNTAARNYIVSNSGDRGKLTQTDINGFVSADSGGFFNMPGGAIALVLGGEYRREDANFKADQDIEDGLTFLNSLQTFNPPALEVAEGFGEVSVPILKDLPFFKSLSVSGAARVSHYNKAYGSTGTVWAWNFGGEWAPVRDIRFRANYGKSVRAPNYTDTAVPLSQNFAPNFGDPCNANRIKTGTPERVANCQAALGATLNNDQFQSLTNGVYSLEIRSGSNPLLTAETSKSLTVGAVVTPRFLPGFDVTVDYFDINVQNVITAATAQQIVDLCYDRNQFCDLFQRNLTGGTLSGGEVPGEIIKGSLIQASLNFASLKRRGIDVQVNYNHNLFADAFLSVRGYYTHLLKNSDYTDPTDPTYETRNLGQLGDPKDEFTFNADLTIKKFTVGYGMHYIGPMLTTDYANLYSINGNPPQNPEIYNITRYPSVFYHNVRASVQLGSTRDDKRGMEWFIGVNNVGNRHAPLNATGLTANSSIYDVLGRSFFSGVRATF
jgi:outer membrane receptor protein involved in Fe transport